MEKWQVPGAQLVEAIARRNIRSSGGSFESYTSEKNIVTLAQFETPEEVEDVIIDVTAAGAMVRVSDIAIVKDAFEPEKVRSRMNGESAISFLVYKKESADIIRTVDRIKEFVAENQHRLPDNIHIEYSNDVSQNVNNRLQVVLYNGALGLVLVLLILTLFLDLRSAIWVAMGIPVALLGTIFLLPMFGAYLDSIALGAMIMVIGIIVDDGIVVAENIWRFREQGMKPLDAAVQGAASVFQPVVTTLLTTGLAFAPMFFMSGTLGDFIYVIPLVVLLALLVSFTELVVALPAHLTWGVKQSVFETSKKSSRINIEVIKKTFGHLLRILLRWRYLVITIAIVALLSAFSYAAKYMDFILFPTQSADRFYVLAELPTGSSLEHTSDTLQNFETIVEALPEGEVESYVTRIGSHGDYGRGENEHWAFVGVFLTPFATRDRNADEIVEDLRRRSTAIDKINRLVFVIDSGGPPVGRPITIRVVGSDDAQRDQLTQLIIKQLNSIDGVKDIARNVRLAFDGEVVTSVRYGDEDVDFRVIFEETLRSSLDSLADLVIPNARGDFIRLEEVADFKIDAGPSNVYHFDNERAITITADVDTETMTPLKASNLILDRINTDKDWPSMRLVVGGEAQESAESMGSLVVAFIAAAVGIYLLLLLLFNSLTQPVLVMIAIPFGMVGVILAFALHQQAFGFLAMLGVVGLIKTTRSELSAHEHIISAAQIRLRPIALTSITTVAGLLPMAYGLGGADPFSAPMALAMGYGILFATPITLVLIPCLLAVMDDLHSISGRFGKI